LDSIFRFLFLSLWKKIRINFPFYYVAFNVLGQDTADARTTALLALIILEICGAYNFLSFRREIKPRSLFANKYLLIASTISRE
jgi:hypothetical protein